MVAVLAATQLAAHGGAPALLKIDARTDPIQIELLFSATDLEARFPAFRDPRTASDPAARAQVRRRVDAYLQKHVVLRRGGQRCNSAWQFAPGGSSLIAAISPLYCPGRGRLTLEADPFFDLGPGHQVIVRALTGSDQTQTAVLRAGAIRVDIVTSYDQWYLFGGFIGDGISHILSGIDHVLFVLGLLLVAGGRLRRIGIAVTGFTAAHTLTLFLATFDIVRLPPAMVEPLIGVSIAYLGMEALLDRRKNGVVAGFTLLHLVAAGAAAMGLLQFPLVATLGLLGFVIAWQRWLRLVPAAERGTADAMFPFAFGLAHGLGFAGPLQVLDLTRADLVTGVLGFNLGVELGQALVIGVAFFAAWGLRHILAAGKWRRLQPVLEVVVAIALLLTGGFWFALRAL